MSRNSTVIAVLVIVGFLIWEIGVKPERERAEAARVLAQKVEQERIARANERANNGAAIISVYEQKNEAFVAFKTDDKKQGHNPLFKSSAATNYVKSLDRIDLSQCPSDFRDAFMEYLRIQNERANAVNSINGIVNLTRDIVTLGVRYPGLLTKADRLEQESSDVELRMKTIAMKYGLQFKP